MMEQTEDPAIPTPSSEPDLDPAAVVEAAAIDGNEAVVDSPPKKKAAAVERPYPRKTLEDALRVPTTIRTNNGGNPWAPSEVAKSLGVGMSGNFFYLTAASRDFGLTDGTREAQAISLTELGRRAVYPTSPEDAEAAKLDAFFNVDIFRKLVEYYGGSKLPESEFVRNTLEATFGLDPRTHDEVLDLFAKNCRFVGVGAEWHGRTAPPALHVASPATPADTRQAAPATVDRDASGVCFVIMPFVERTDAYATGFFEEVFASLFKPAIEAAGFEARTAKRQGSDVIHATIINELYDADLVLADLTEHNPNVLFELGVRMASELPIALVRAKGTNPIFDVDNMLRVESYNPNLWPSTVEKDIPRLQAHVEEAWVRRTEGQTYMSLLRRA